MGTMTSAGAGVAAGVTAVIVAICIMRSCCWRVLIVSCCYCINAKSYSIVGVVLYCYCCDIGKRVKKEIAH